MRWTEDFIAVDWGTTNRRGYRIDAQGKCVAEFEDDRGILSLPTEEFPAAAAQIRERLGDLPLLLAGMVGSRSGWVETPYVQCPADLDEIAAQLSWVEEGRAAIVPGLSILKDDRADVMRGEEVQIFGVLAAGLIPATGFVCHPGTHNKWIKLDQGQITDFRTVMTGEMFSLLRERGVLADMIGGTVSPGEPFRAGVRQGLGCMLTAELFTVRARILLGRLEREDAASFTSGLLIGADVGLGLALGGETDPVVMGRPELTQLYAAAIAEAGRSSRQIDGETAFLAGAVAIARKIG
ncbi:MAG TPA: 2-dehydro-3-deoxygalactonokinase [Sphingomicrobium sp.]|nr:2-dehydro-3-deoxygalactonokinase [Sphingomicrobium sp.]